MTSQTENSKFDINLVDLLQKQFSEEKKAHGETILKLLSAQAQAQTAEDEAAKAQELVAETTLKLDQAREEIRGLRDQAQGAQILAQEAQAKIKDLEAQMAQIKVIEKSQAAIEAQAQELKTAEDKIVSLEAQMAKVRAVVGETEMETNPAQTQELQAKIENLEAQVAQLTFVKQFHSQTQELKTAQEKNTKLEAQMAQNEKQAKKEIEAAQAKLKDLEAKVQSKPKAPVQANKSYWNPPPLSSSFRNADCLKVENLNESPAPWFIFEHLRFFKGTHLRLGKSGLKSWDMVEFLNSWLTGTHPNLETIVLNEFEMYPTCFDKFASSLVRECGGDSWDRRNYDGSVSPISKTFHLERPSDGRIACVKITRNLFIFIV